MTDTSKRPQSGIKMLVIGLALGLAPALAFYLADRNAPEGVSLQTVIAEVRKGDAVRDALMANPEMIVAALQKYDSDTRRAATEADQPVIAEAAEPKGAIVIGSAEPAVTIVEFNDYNCPFCRKAIEAFDQLMQTRDDVRLIVRDIPIIRPAESREAALVAGALRLQSQDLAHAFYRESKDVSGTIDRVKALEIAKSIGADLTALDATLDDESLIHDIQANIDFAQKLRVSGTPTIFINGERFDGFIPFEKLLSIIEAKAKANPAEAPSAAEAGAESSQ